MFVGLHLDRTVASSQESQRPLVNYSINQLLNVHIFSDFEEGTSFVRRLGCLHLFHVSCVDAWFIKNRYTYISLIDS